jgi:hypothetical protein
MYRVYNILSSSITLTSLIFVLTLGDHLATPEHFKSYEEAEKSIAAIDWNLVASLAICLIEGVKKMENEKKEENKQC